jgi:DNA-binding transcriptional LysR family regulator
VQIDDLRGLLMLGEHEHVTGAAAALRTTQPTLSRLLARAEALLGTRLFERDARGVHPNPLGEITLTAAREIDRELAPAARHFRSIVAATGPYA